MNTSNKIFIFIAICLYLPLSTASTEPVYVGDQPCKSCHLKEHQQWQGSHHDLAMQEANDKSVLGDFNKSSFKKENITSTFFKENNRYMVNTDGADGQLHEYEISYTFGVYPLQQYMVKFPQGKIQVLDIAWDSRSKEEGGVSLLQKAAELEPDNARYQYVYAVTVAENQPEQAIQILLASLQNHSGNLEILSALVSYYKQQGDTENSNKYRQKVDRMLRYKVQ